MLNLTVNNFDNELKTEMPVLVDFWATWCGPCKMIAPEVEKIAAEFEGKIKVGKLDVDEEVAVAIKYKVEVIPTLVLFKNGEEVKRLIGFNNAEEIKKGLGL